MELKPVLKPSRKRIRKARRDQAAFPGERAWLLHNQMQVERLVSPMRAGMFLFTGVAWFVLPHARLARPDLATAIVIIAVVYAIADLALVYRFPNVVGKIPWASTVIGLFVINGWIYATGGPESPFLAIGFLGVVASS